MSEQQFNEYKTARIKALCGVICALASVLPSLQSNPNGGYGQNPQQDVLFKINSIVSSLENELRSQYTPPPPPTSEYSELAPIGQAIIDSGKQTTPAGTARQL